MESPVILVAQPKSKTIDTERGIIDMLTLNFHEASVLAAGWRRKGTERIRESNMYLKSEETRSGTMSLS